MSSRHNCSKPVKGAGYSSHKYRCPQRKMDMTGKESHTLALVFCCCMYDHQFHQKRNATQWKKFHLPDLITIMLESYRCSIELLLIWNFNLVTIAFTHRSAACSLWFTLPFIHQQISEALCNSPCVFRPPCLSYLNIDLKLFF